MLLQTIDEIYTDKQEIKKSTFLSYLCPFSEFETLHKKLKDEHPKAVHIVWAYRYYNKYHQIIENQSDDGEPKGTSGAPSLNSLRGAGLINSAVLVVRYFGGIKLGTGGLVRAYSSSVNLAIDKAKLLDYEIKDSVCFFAPFALISRFEHFFEKENLSVLKEFNEFGMVGSIELSPTEFKSLYEFSHAFLNDGFSFTALPLFAKDMLK